MTFGRHRRFQAKGGRHRRQRPQMPRGLVFTFTVAAYTGAALLIGLVGQCLL